MKSKYNTGSPIDIKTLTAKERKQAFHEWAEGSPALEKLLNEGYSKGFLSLACCGGDTGHPYICYDLNDEKSRKMAMVVATKLSESSHDCQITIYDDFWLNDAYPETYTTRNITGLHVEALLENKEEVFKVMRDTIKHARLKNIELPTSKEQLPQKRFDKKKEPVGAVNNKILADLTDKVYGIEENTRANSFNGKVHGNVIGGRKKVEEIIT